MASMFIMKKTPKARPGNPNAVMMVDFCELFPVKVLYILDVTNPATPPMRT
eukprot:CAMPEP_0194093228 /NCGR_PEP_ID=MMETSP0149-20130528/49693_1 /TAXON_ID=122233 /ORGANISM="Chaetoceros debilis, Strain MM31A-1" /LENGTH=50 /DNA_ID=CAMNT_0038778461 /DNA_START=42 /DNA_END=191 /DNA_ORIENTATION=+